MIRVAAVSDLHFTPQIRGTVRTRLARVREDADLLLMPGDLIDSGTLEDAALMCGELAEVGVPMVAVPGNHEYAARKLEQVAAVYRSAGIIVLEGQTATVEVRGEQIGIVGVKGGMGGFGEHSLFPSMEPEVVLWHEAARRDAEAIERGLAGLGTTFRIVLLHYSPCRETVEGEHPEEIPFYGNSWLGEPVDRLGADLVVHGHSHHGSSRGTMPGGAPVYNVAAPVIGPHYVVLELGR